MSRSDWHKKADTKEATFGGDYFHSCPPSPSCATCTGLQTAEYDWSAVDAAYCISLQEREDRAQSVATQFHRVGLCRLVRFYRPNRHPEAPIAGIWESHRTVLADALRRGYDTVLVMEDDVKFVRWYGPRMSRLVMKVARSLPERWQIFYLGHWPLKMRFLSLNLVKTHSACTHAYIANTSLMRLMADQPYGSVKLASLIGKGVDAYYATLGQTYAFFPMVAIQNATASDHVLAHRRGRIRKLSHLITRTRSRELLLSSLMRPAELLAAFTAAVARLGAVFRRNQCEITPT